jgi:hypothetical protein
MIDMDGVIDLNAGTNGLQGALQGVSGEYWRGPSLTSQNRADQPVAEFSCEADTARYSIERCAHDALQRRT